MRNILKWQPPSAALLATGLVLSACGAYQTARLNARPSRLALPVPLLPAQLYAYSDATAPLPRQFLRGGPGGPPPPPPPRAGRGGPQPPPPPRGGPGGRGGPAIAADRTPASNPTTDAGATLGRVLFYDPRLSENNTTSCSSCHNQAFGFGDTARFSVGLYGERTARHAMALANARFYASGRYFWDERAESLEAQVLQPIQNRVEMGMTLDALVPKLQSTSYYPALFTAAFGTGEVSNDRIARALSQFVRSLVSGQSRFDRAFAENGPPDFSVLTPEEQEGQRIFTGRGGCAACHGTSAQVLDRPHNNGLDDHITDQGAGGGRFKAPSLRNVAVRAPYMHDGRFKTLQDVVDFYDHGVQESPELDPRLRGGGPGGPGGRVGPPGGRGAPPPGRGGRGGPPGEARRLNLSTSERDALVAYLESLTDSTFLTAPKFANPFTTTR